MDLVDLLVDRKRGHARLLGGIPYRSLPVYLLKDPEECARIIRKEVSKAYDLPDNDDHLTVKQVMGLLEEKCERDGDDFMLSDKILEAVAEQAQSMFLGSMLSKMAAEGELECAWDEEKNDMVFRLPKKKT